MEKILFVVGGSSDIGIGTIKELIGEFSLVIASFNHMNESLEKLRQENEKKLLCIHADLSDEESTKFLIDTIKKNRLVPSHILHLPAVRYEVKKFHKIPWSIFENQIHVSLRSAVMILSAFLPDMAKRQNGHILVMLSLVVGGIPPKHSTDYVMVKYALLGLVKSLSIEYADKGITVNGISPALVETRFIEGMHDYLIEQNAKQSPTGKNLIIDDIIPTIKFLFSDGAGCINGQNIFITCGR